MRTKLPGIRKLKLFPWEADVNRKDFFIMKTIENMVTVVMTVALVVGLGAVFQSWHCMWGMLLMLNQNNPIAKSEECEVG